MLRTIFAAGAVAAALATVPVVAQQSQLPATEADLVLVGLPIYSSDGELSMTAAEVGETLSKQKQKQQQGQ